MKVHAAHLENFRHWKDRRFDLNPGVTLITGANGSGKTTLLESLVWAIWGRKLRPAALDPACRVRLWVGDVAQVSGAEEPPYNLTRRLTGQGERVDFGERFRDANKTRASEALASIFGDYEAWHRTLFVTGRTVSRFALGTPKEKFDHLVEVTGGSAFDRALKALKVRQATETLAQRDSFDQDVHFSEIAVGKARSALGGLNAGTLLVPGGADLATLSAEQEALRAEHREIHDKKSALDASWRDKELALANMKSARDACMRAYAETTRALCESCGQSVPAKGDGDLAEEIAGLLVAIDTCGAELAGERLSSSVLDVRIASLKAARRENQQRLDEAQKSAEALQVYEGLVQVAVRSLVEALQRHDQALAASAAHREVQRKLDLAGRVLAEARKRYLASFSGRIEAHANHYLSVVGSKLRLRLPFEDGKLKVLCEGLGAPSYEDLSGGEGRRADLVLCLAMSQAAAEAGTVPSSAPLVIDEAFDTLDADGVEALIYLACEIAKRRQVLLVSHAEPGVPFGPSVTHLRLP